MASFRDIVEEPYTGSYLKLLNLNLPIGTGMEHAAFTSIGGNFEKTLGEVRVEEAPARNTENFKPVAPLLVGMSCFISPSQEFQPGFRKPAAVTTAAATTTAAVPVMSKTPVERRTRGRRRSMGKSGLELGKVEVQDRPDWLPSDWEMERRVRGSGATSGMVDTFYYDPIKHRQFRSKTEVLSYLATGVRERRKRKSDDSTGFSDMMASSSGKHGSTSKRKKTPSNYDSNSPPERVSQVLNPNVQGSWISSIGVNTALKLPRQESNAAFSFLTEVGQSNPKVGGASW